MRTTMKIFHALSIVAALAASTTACKKDEKQPSAGEAKTAEGEKKPAAGPLVIEALGLAIDAPAGSQVSEMLGDQLIQGPGLVVTVGAAKETTPKTLDAAVSEADMYSPTVTKKETTADGYHLEFKNSGSMGANYFVQVLRTIGDKPYLCSTTAPDEKMAAAAAAACTSLRAK